MNTLQEAYRFWFADARFHDPEYLKERSRIWFGKNLELDQEIRSRFASALTSYAAAPERPVDLKDRLGEIILLDQFPRNAFRGTPKSFAFDDLALARAKTLLPQLRALHICEALFALLPFEHSENLQDQELSVTKFSELANSAPPPFTAFASDILDYAERHQRIIARFGRFPHRNEILGRASTPDELEFLKTPGSHF